MNASRNRVAAGIVLGGAMALFVAACSGQTIECDATIQGGCSCLSDSGQDGNDVACAPADEAFCCARAPWPEEISTCECTGAWTCRDFETFCTCTLGPTVIDAGTPVAACDLAPYPGEVCCVFDDSCTCGRDACGKYHTQVADCGFGTVSDLLTEYTCVRNDLAVVDTCVVD